MNAGVERLSAAGRAAADDLCCKVSAFARDQNECTVVITRRIGFLLEIVLTAPPSQSTMPHR